MLVNKEYDQIIIGAGIVGISLGLAIFEQNPNKKVLIIDKEGKPGVHASGRNSGVLHAGFYYSPESLKAKFCRLGNLELRKFCKENNLEVIETGKVVVFQDKKDVERLENLFGDMDIWSKPLLTIINDVFNANVSHYHHTFLF